MVLVFLRNCPKVIEVVNISNVEIVNTFLIGFSFVAVKVFGRLRSQIGIGKASTMHTSVVNVNTNKAKYTITLMNAWFSPQLWLTGAVF